MQAHNCRITGHTIEENSLSGQMMCSAGVMTFTNTNMSPVSIA